MPVGARRDLVANAPGRRTSTEVEHIKAAFLGCTWTGIRLAVTGTDIIIPVLNHNQAMPNIIPVLRARAGARVQSPRSRNLIAAENHLTNFPTSLDQSCL